MSPVPDVDGRPRGAWPETLLPLAVTGVATAFVLLSIGFTVFNLNTSDPGEGAPLAIAARWVQERPDPPG
jgi:hypothetical protein